MNLTWNIEQWRTTRKSTSALTATQKSRKVITAALSAERGCREILSWSTAMNTRRYWRVSHNNMQFAEGLILGGIIGAAVAFLFMLMVGFR
jgi:hypothetical protein